MGGGKGTGPILKRECNQNAVDTGMRKFTKFLSIVFSISCSLSSHSLLLWNEWVVNVPSSEECSIQQLCLRSKIRSLTCLQFGLIFSGFQDDKQINFIL